VVPVADPAFGWQEALAAFAVIAVAAFLVTWVLTDRLRIRRTPYVPVLLVVALGLAHIVLHGQLLIRGAELPPAMPRGPAVSI
jgi:cyanate permease